MSLSLSSPLSVPVPMSVSGLPYLCPSKVYGYGHGYPQKINSFIAKKNLDIYKINRFITLNLTVLKFNC
jgi:hypothetical protein